MTDVFRKLSAINVNESKERKGKFDYLPWTDAWSILKEHYPDATHDMLDDVYYPDGSMEVRSSVTVNGQTQKCFLPVIDHKNNAIKNPNAFDVNKNRMRCLAKNIALFGLGLYIFRGEDLPEERGATDEDWAALCRLIAEGDAIRVCEFTSNLNEKQETDLFNMAEHGQKTKFKNQVRELEKACQVTVEEYAAGIGLAIDSDASDSLGELLAELADDKFLKNRVWAQLSPVTQQQVKDAIA